MTSQTETLFFRKNQFLSSDVNFSRLWNYQFMQTGVIHMKDKVKLIQKIRATIYFSCGWVLFFTLCAFKVLLLMGACSLRKREAILKSKLYVRLFFVYLSFAFLQVVWHCAGWCIYFILKHFSNRNKRNI